MEDIEVGAVIEGFSGTHFLVVKGREGLRLVNIDADFYLLDPTFKTADEIVAWFDRKTGDKELDSFLAIDRVIPKWTECNWNPVSEIMI